MERLNKPSSQANESKAKRPEGLSLETGLQRVFTSLIVKFNQKVMDQSQSGLYLPFDPTNQLKITNHDGNRRGVRLPPDIVETLPYLGGTVKGSFPVPHAAQVSMEDSVNFMIPIGYYGKEWSLALAQTGFILCHLAAYDEKTNIIEESREINEQYKDLISATFRGNSLRTMLDGAQTIALTTQDFTAEKIGNYENPLVVFNHFIRDNMLNVGGSIMPDGVAVPLSLSGLYIPDAVQELPNSMLFFTKQFTATMSDAHKYLATQNSRYRHLGCPVARGDVHLDDGNHVEESGINLYAKLFQTYLLHFYTLNQKSLKLNKTT